MSAKKPTSKDIAFWRLEQIKEALCDDITPQERGKILHRVSRTPVLWPSGQTKPVTEATAYRWIASHIEGGFDALKPKRRSDLGVTRIQLPGEVIAEALRKLTEDPGISLTFLLAVLRPMFPTVQIPRSTLYQRLVIHPDYLRIKWLKRYSKRRTRFVARAPHHIWQTDAKGPARVTLTDGSILTFHVLSILDDATRAVLVAIVSLHANLGAAVRVFRAAVTRWGLADKLYADRASIFDSHSFRMGLALLGDHRILSRPNNPEARGKIEAYHRTLGMWFFDRLAKQVVIDLGHLQQLLDGVIYGLYQPHKHRGIKVPPAVALAGRVSTRIVPPTRLVEAFRQERRLKTHPKTGEIELGGITYLVPDELRGQRLTFLLDPPGEVPPMVQHPISGKSLALRRAAIKPSDLEDNPNTIEPAPRWGHGNLQAIYDNWQGRRRPLAEPGFGLPEIYTLLAEASGRFVPQSDAEAALIQDAYRDIGPLPQAATQNALRAIAKELGPRRPVKTYLDALIQRARETSNKQRT